MAATRIACVGAWGHWYEPLNEVADGDPVELVGAAAGYDGESLEPLFTHRLWTAESRAWGDAMEMIKAARPEVVVVSSRLDRNATLAMQAIRTGVRRVIVETPLALDVATLGKLWRLVNESRTQLRGMLRARHQSSLAAARAAIAAGTIGEVVLVQAHKSCGRGERPDWWAQRRLYGGTIAWLGAEAFDAIDYITGLGVRRVAAQHKNRTHASWPACEDTCAIVAELEGALATVSLDFLRPPSAPTCAEDELRIVGTRGTIVVNTATGTCALVDDGGGPRPLPHVEPPLLYRNFLQGRETNGHGATSTDDAFRVTLAALIARDAADRGEWMEVE